MEHKHLWKLVVIKGIMFDSNTIQFECQCGITKNIRAQQSIEDVMGKEE